MNLLKGAWQFLTAPRFTVNIDSCQYIQANGFVTAGEKTKACTISVSLDHKGELDKSKYVRPLSNYYQDDRVYVTCENERWIDRKLVLDMFVYVTVAGAYAIVPKFPEDSYVQLYGKIKFQVKPSNTCYILLKKYVNSNPIKDECSTKMATSYRGDTVKIYVEVVDKFQNKYTDDLGFRIVSGNQSLKMVHPTSRDTSNGWYVVSVRYQKIGTTTFVLSLREDEMHLHVHTLSQEVKVIPPPVSIDKSYIIQSDIDKIQERIHEAGQAIAVKLKLIDIIGNPISYAESKVFLEKALGLVSRTGIVKPMRRSLSRNKGISSVSRNKCIVTMTRDYNGNEESVVPKVCPLDEDSNSCEVEFTLTIAGQRVVSLFADNETEEISTLTLKVQPGPLEELQIVKQDPIDFVNVYRGDTAKIWVMAKDQFGNRIVKSSLKFDVFSDRTFVKLLSTDYSEDLKKGIHQLTVRWENVGKGAFSLIASQGSCQVRKDIPLEVIPPPVSAAKSYIIQSDIHEIQERIHEAGQAISVKLKLNDIFGNAICYEESKSFVESIRLAFYDTSLVSGVNQGSSKKSLQSTREETSSKMCPNSGLYSSNDCEANSALFSAKGKPTVTKNLHESNLELNTALKVRPLETNSNSCEVEFTPTIAGKIQVSLFADNETEEISTLTLKVQPSPLEELQIVKQDPIDFVNVYRGDTAKIWVMAKDQFGNRIVKSSLKFDVFSDRLLVKLLSTDYSEDLKKGSHQLTVRWENVGKGSFNLIASQGSCQVRKDIPLEVIPPPVSAAKSYIIQGDIHEIQERIHEAGQAISVKLKLNDIFGNAICYEESKSFVESIRHAFYNTSLVSGVNQGSSKKSLQSTRKQNSSKMCPNSDFYSSNDCEANSALFSAKGKPTVTKNLHESNLELNTALKVRPLETNSNSCEVEFTPTIAGKIQVSLFADNETEEISTLTLKVQPSPLEELQIVKQDPIDFVNVYRGDTAKIWVMAKDQFGNRIVKSSLKFDVFSDRLLVKLLSTDYSEDLKKGIHQLTVRWENVGKGSFNLIASQGSCQVRKDIPLEVIPPPVSAAKSYIIQGDIHEIQERIHEAGQAISLRLKLIDIFGNAICYEESKTFVESIRLSFHDTSHEKSEYSSGKSVKSTREENSFKRSPSEVNSNTCVLTFTPYIVGKRLLSFSLHDADKKVKESPLSFVANPGPVAEVQIVSHEPPASKQNIFSSYAKHSRTVIVKGKDEFGNEVVMNAIEWCLDALGGLKEEATFVNEENDLVFQYRFDKPGTYKVDIKPKDSITKLSILPFFAVEITKAPLDVSKCLCVCENEKPIFVGETQSSFRIRVSLFDCIGNRYSLTEDSEFKAELLLIKVNDQAGNVIAHESGTEEGEIYVTTVLDNRIIDTKHVQVIYNDEPLGEELSVKIVGIQPYRTDEFVRLYKNKKEIRCKDVCREMLADYANLDNINRIVQDPGDEDLKSSDINENTDNQQVKLINVVLKKFESKTLPVFLEIISLFVKGTHHYRNQANEFDREREKWKNKSIDAYFSGKHEEAKACSDIKEKFATLMNQCHGRASDAIFEFYNKGRPQSEIDLHGQLVADSVKMKEYKEQLRSKGERSAAEVDAIIEREQQERDEAIRKLDEQLRNFDHDEAKRVGEDWLEIIDGAGHHSARRGEQKIRPKVKEYLGRKNIKYVEANKGALLINFSEYTGKEPCVADFYCKRCKKTWTSATSWKRFFQRCFRCYRKGIYPSECYPFKLRSVRPHRRQRSGDESMVSNLRMTREDHRKLCQKCIVLGKDCMAQ